MLVVCNYIQLMKTCLQIHFFHTLDILTIKVNFRQTYLLLLLNNGEQLISLRQLLYVN